MSLKKLKIGCIVNDEFDYAKRLGEKIINKYNFKKINFFSLFAQSEFDVILVLGGDGLMIRAIHYYIGRNIRFYGINCGSVGFLMNGFDFENECILDKIHNALESRLPMIKSRMCTLNNVFCTAFGVNEVALLRNTTQTTHIRIFINNKSMMDCLVGDGVMLSTPAGSTAYNFSAGGPVLPLDSELLALTPISPFRPRKWSGAILPRQANVLFEVIDIDKRPANLFVDHRSFSDVKFVEMSISKENETILLFDRGHELKDRILNEQFMS